MGITESDRSKDHALLNAGPPVLAALLATRFLHAAAWLTTRLLVPHSKTEISSAMPRYWLMNRRSDCRVCIPRVDLPTTGETGTVGSAGTQPCTGCRPRNIIAASAKCAFCGIVFLNPESSVKIGIPQESRGLESRGICSNASLKPC